MTGLLAPRERNKTITCLAGAEPVAGAGTSGVQRLQFFLSESPWEAELVDDRRLELLREQSATAPHDGGVIVIDDSGDREDGTATANVGRQWLGRLGKTDNGIVTVTTVWTDGRVYYPLHATPYTPAHHFARGRSDPAFRTKPQRSAALAARGKEAGFGCRAVIADAPTPSVTPGISHCARQAWPTWSRSNRTAVPGPRPTSHTLPSKPPML
ncbi:transposase [Streptomyces sp. NPDC023723]|uniref:IS701 family transposase n=1 Tax=Streptomyces sp. NPDC023723 TaxID=3154323 RepID=UPI0033E4329F